MPVYESIKNADNKIVISAQNRDSVVFGWDKVVAAIADKAGKANTNIAIDGCYCLTFEKIAKALADKISANGVKVELIDAADLYKSREDIIAYNAPYVTEDPGFGKVNKTGVIEDIMCQEKIAEIKAELAKKDKTVLIYGVGAAIKAFEDVLDINAM